MKGVYWRPKKISKRTLIGLAIVAAACMAVVELAPSKRVENLREEKLAAARLAAEGMDVIKAERLRRGHDIVPELDPAETGMIGHSMSMVTSVTGHLEAKQTSVNPNFAAVIVEMLRESGVKRGDCVAVGCSGSFPAMNLCVYAALETLGVRPIIVSSAAASQWGANIPELMWADMECSLEQAGLISFRSIAGSLGGFEDRGLGMTEDAKQLLRAALRRNRVEILESNSLEEAVNHRMSVYLYEAGVDPIAAYVNVGGGASSVGRTEGKHAYEPGMNEEPSAEALAIDSVMTRFAADGVPLIHLVEIKQLARRYGLPECPQTRPVPGAGGVFVKMEYDRVLAVMFLAGIVIALYGFVLSGFRRPLVKVAQFLHLSREARGPRLAAIASEAQGEFMV